MSTEREREIERICHQREGERERRNIYYVTRENERVRDCVTRERGEKDLLCH